MGIHPLRKYGKVVPAVVCTCLLVCSLCMSACQSSAPFSQAQSPSPTATQHHGVQITPPQLPGQQATPTQGTSQPAAQPGQSTVQPTPVNARHPLLAFYYTWYSTSTWCACRMSDLPTIQYNSSDDATIDRQLTWAANAGITGFINSWWGPGDQTDQNFAKLLAHSATLEEQTHYHFASTLYIESDASALSGTSNMVNALNYINTHYSNDPHFFHWQGKPVLFFWNPLGNGRTLAQWTAIRSQVNPHNQMIWSAEGIDTSVLSVFDGIHLFSAGYWGILHNDMATVDQTFRAKIDDYNNSHHTHKIWAAGVLPGYDDTRVPGRTGTYVVPRNNGATYKQSWAGALASQPDWITITSFNEWFEGAMIEPSVTYGMQYLTITQQFARQWSG